MNNLEPKERKIEDMELTIEEGYPLIKAKVKSGQTLTMILKPINDTEAIIEGLGRSMKETIYMKDGVFHYMGLRFEKIKGKK